MKIVAGLGSLEDLLPLAEAGADEVFCGYVPGKWYEKFSDVMPLNRREVLLQSIQIDTLGDMRLLFEMARERNVSVAVTFNAPVYAPEQIAYIENMMTELAAIGYDRWIVADIALLCAMVRDGIPGSVHLSGEAGAFTADAAGFFVERFPVSRLIFPRRSGIWEMGECAERFPKIEREAFILNENCHYSGAFCMSLHCDAYEPMCRVEYRPVGPDVRVREASIDEGFGSSGCGLCALEALKAAGITHLKVVGRGAHPEQIRRDVRLLRHALALSSDQRRAEFAGNCGGHCYYPSAGRQNRGVR